MINPFRRKYEVICNGKPSLPDLRPLNFFWTRRGAENHARGNNHMAGILQYNQHWTVIKHD